MKILHVVTGLSKANGVSVFLCELAAEQARRGHEVAILVKWLGEDRYPVDERVQVLSTMTEFSAVRLRFSTSPVVHIHALWDPWLTKMARVAHQAGCKIVWSPHGMLTPWALRNKWPKKFLGLLAYQYWSLRKADLLHATADTEVEDVRRLMLKNPLVLAPLGVHIHSTCSSCSMRQKYVCFVSRVQRKKGLLNLIEAWAKLPAEFRKDWCIKIAGPDQDNHTAELMSKCEQLGLSYADPTGCVHSTPTPTPHTSIQFLGPVYGEAKDALYANAAFSVLPTHSENFGSVVIESLAQCTPVICTKGAPWKDLVDYKCGWWIDIGVEPLVEALKTALSTSISNLNLLGQNGRKLVESKYNWESVAKTIEEAYAKLFH